MRKDFVSPFYSAERQLGLRPTQKLRCLDCHRSALWLQPMGKITRPLWRFSLLSVLCFPVPLLASEADIKIPELSKVAFNGLGGMSGATLMYIGLLICV